MALARRFLATLLVGLVHSGMDAAPATAVDRPIKIALLCAGACPTMPSSPYLRELTAALDRVGLIEGRDLIWDVRGVTSEKEQLPRLASELAARRPQIIIAWGSAAAAGAARAATQTIPIVMIGVPDAIENGLVESLHRPGRNLTGLSVPSAELNLKQIQILREIDPKLEQVVLVMSATEASRVVAAQVSTAAAALGVQVRQVQAKDGVEIDHALGRLEARRRTALIVSDEWLVSLLNRRTLLSFAVTTQTPLVGRERGWVRSGALFSYGPAFSALAERGASFIQRIVAGARPADLPVEQPDRYEFVLNATTAKALKLAVPVAVQTRADEIVE